MSIRAINFLHRWIANNVPETADADVISTDDGECLSLKFAQTPDSFGRIA
ncbi:DUF768 domain-containing protein [Mesorhizobium sp. M8A.F.Ca.ET.021.01.1.1]|nr:DUF768 domain-containing protein [Mesorhizobium sp. M8A.F.Ca.ET.021.01.1.1]